MEQSIRITHADRGAMIFTMVIVSGITTSIGFVIKGVLFYFFGSC